MKTSELTTTLSNHLKWLRGEPGGTRAVLRNADLSGAVLRNADLSGADLSGAFLSGAVLSGAVLRNADLSRADLSRADLSGADLSDADLRGADLRNADLSGADLSGADLRDAGLSGADLRDADLSGADLSGADLSGADLSESTGIPFAQCSWTGHGERGRQLLGIALPDGIRLFCGCFSGSPDDLRAYIKKGAEAHRASRMKAFEFVMSCLPTH